MPSTKSIVDVRDPTVAGEQRVQPGDRANRAIRVNLVAGGAGGGVVQQGARDATFQPWAIRIAINDVPTYVDPRDRNWTLTETVAISAVSLPLPTGAATETTLAARLAESTFTARINTQGQKAMAASTPVVIASDQSAVPVSGTVTANPALGFGKTLQFAVVNQAAAGTTEIVAAVVGQRIKVVSYVIVLSLTGTAKWQSGAATGMCGPMDLATNGGVALASDVSNPLMQTVAGEALNIVTTLGAARGHISYFTEA